MGFSVGVLSESLRDCVKPALLPLCMGLQSSGVRHEQGHGFSLIQLEKLRNQYE